MASFDTLGLSAEVLAAIKRKGFEVPTPIQEKTIPAILQGAKDIVAQAQTGTGKTAAFGLPILDRIKSKSGATQALILTPTRELAIQVAEEIHSFIGSRSFSIIPVYGGQSIELQLKRLKRGVDIVVGTPGRILDHLRRGTLKLDRIEYLVLDEADEMLNMGFLEDVRDIIKQTNPERRTLLFSATMPDEIKQIAEKYMKGYEVLQVSKGQLTASQTEQIYFEVPGYEKFEALCRILDMEEEFYGLVFCRTKVDVDSVSSHLGERGYDAEALHGDMSQSHREKILAKFKKGTVNVLVATDVAARGIDVQNLTHVINYALPQDPEAYVHRIGRTGRAGREGIAITFVTPAEYRQLQFIQRKVQTSIRRAELPTKKELARIKRERIMTRLEEVLKASPGSDYVALAENLLSKHKPVSLLAGVLQHFLQEQLGDRPGTDAESANVDRKGKTRLFIKKGQSEGWTEDKVIRFLVEQCGITQNHIQDVEVLDRFSFVSLPFQEAETVLAQFKKGKKKRSAPMISKARPMQKEERKR